MTTKTELNLTADIIDVRDIIVRVEELEKIVEEGGLDAVHGADNQERMRLQFLLDELAGNGGDEQWRGDWYPTTLVRDSQFTDYARELLEDCGTIPRDLPDWVEIDWERTARNVRMDYTATEINGATYWYR